MNYSQLTDPSVYQTGNNIYTYPFIKRTLPVKVVSNVISDNGINNNGNTTTYNYTGLKYNVHGKGLLGFDKVVSKDIVKDITLEKNFALNLTYGFPWLQNTYLKQGQQVLSLTTSGQDVYHYGNQRILPYTTQTTSTDNIKNTTATETYVYSLPDNNPLAEANSMITGKPKSITTNKGNGLEITTQTFTYPGTVIFDGTGYANIPAWLYAKTKSIVTTNTRQGQLPYTRRQNLSYNSATGLLQNSISDLATSHTIITNNTYNVYGNLVQKKVSASGLAPRIEIFQYDATNRFVTKSYNADYLAIQTNTVYDIITGTVSSIIQADGLTKNFTYDGFGRVKTTTDNSGGSATTDNLWAAGNPYAPVNAKYLVQATSNTSGTIYTFHDRLGRLVRSVSKGLNGQMIFADEHYDNKGQLISKTDPYFQGTSVQNNAWTYDNLGRVTYQSTPSGNNSSFAYALTTSGAMVTATNAAGQSKKTYTDKSGTVSKTEDEGGVLEYVYHSNGNMKTTTLNGTTVQQTVYDTYGRQTKRTDPNYGSYDYTYNNFDEVLSQKDPKGTIYNFTYNNMGNISTKSGPEGVYAYTYNTVTGTNCGKLTQLTGPGGITHNYGYGMGGKVNYAERIIGTEIFKTQFAYSGNGKLYQTTYPNGTIVRHGYNDNNGDYEGAMLYNPNLSNSWWLYRIKTQNAFGQNTSINLNESMGVGGGSYLMNTAQQYTAFGLLTGQKTVRNDNTVLRHQQYNFQPTTGNLLQRKDLKYNLQEDFTFDNVNRLTGGQAQMISSPAPISTLQMNYTVNGNVTQKSDAGTFSYDQANRVSEINPYINIPEIPQNITYAPFDKVATIEEGVNKAQFSYWADGDRAKMELLENNVLKKTKYYAGDYEKEIDAATGEVRELCYVYGPDDNLMSILERKNGEDKTFYILTDHLGSITQILDENGNIVEEKSFDAWGRSRNPQTWAALPPTGTSNGWDRGYTGHEQLPQFGIINMNGRLYDPLMGRMMEPDPLIIGANNSQGYNRYSYALNNPLSYTDPDGHNPLLIAVAIGAAVSALSYTAHVAYSDGGFANWNWDQFIFNTALGGMSGAVTWGIGQGLAGVVIPNILGSEGLSMLAKEGLRAGLHGVSNYMISGGDIRQGLAGVAGSVAGSISANIPVLNTDVGGLLFSMGAGGATSSLAGGNFLEGAITAGLVHGLNQMMHEATMNDGDEERNPAQDKKLTPGEIKKLKDYGWNHRDKGDHGGQTDLYRDPSTGEVYQKPKGGRGYGEPIGINWNEVTQKTVQNNSPDPYMFGASATPSMSREQAGAVLKVIGVGAAVILGILTEGAATPILVPILAH
jgi:RHS repeat-associated protein